MKQLISISAFGAFRRREDGASLIEYTVVISLFLLVFFAILDFGRLGFNWVMTEKAMQRAVRIAAVRPPVCDGVPETHDLATGAGVSFGTLCRDGNICQPEATQSCVLGGATAFDATNPCTAPVAVAALPNNPTQAQIDARNAQLRLQAAQEIWCVLEPILPSNAAPNNIRISYIHDPDLGFAGGPYTPMVEVGIVTAADTNITGSAALRFEFITPIPALAALAGGGAGAANIDAPGTGGSGLPSIPFPDMSVSLPGEDLNHGTNG